MSAVDYLEPGLTPLTDPWVVEAGGVNLSQLGITRIEGLEDIPEGESDSPATGGDGSTPAPQRLLSRALTITMEPHPDTSFTTAADWATWANSTVDQIKTAFSPLPDRTNLRRLRFRLPGYPQTRRLSYRPASGQKPVEIVVDQQRVGFAKPVIVIRIEAPDPIVYSDARHDLEIAANTTTTIHNAGTFTAVLPTGWSMAAFGGAAALTVRHLDYPESVRVAGAGSGNRIIYASRAVYGPGPTRLAVPADAGIAVPRWPLLRPGNNRIRTSLPGLFSWRDTYA